MVRVQGDAIGGLACPRREDQASGGRFVFHVEQIKHHASRLLKVRDWICRTSGPEGPSLKTEVDLSHFPADESVSIQPGEAGRKRRIQK